MNEFSPTPSVPGGMGALALAPLVVGVVCVLAGLVLLGRARRRRQHWRTRPGRVVASRLDGGQFRYQVAFDQNGREVRFWNRYTTAVGVDPVGREVEVLVNPENPADAVVSRGTARPEAIGIGVVAFGVIALAVAWSWAT